jgi:anaerobic magnesium-protoporphyrin IX monomethyl ester cyclase
MFVTLIRPPFSPTGFDQQFQEPLNLGYLAAVLRREGFKVRLLDAEFCDLNVDAVLQEVANEKPDVVGLSLMSSGGLGSTVKIARGIREWAAPKAHITVGGHFATYRTEYLLRLAPEVDSAVLYEGENVIAELVRRCVEGGDWRAAPGIAFRKDPGSDSDGGVYRTEKASPILDLDGLPFPARDLLPRAIQLGIMPAVLSSRGCSGACSFCTIHKFMRVSSGRAWRGRSPANVMAEIRALVENFRVGEVGFLDDDFIGTRAEGMPRARAGGPADSRAAGDSLQHGVPA